jgi:adenylate kinase
MLEGIILKITPSWLFNILVMKTIFYSVLIFLYIIENRIDYSLKDLGAYFRKEELLRRLNELIQRDRMDAFWYFLLMSATVFIHKWSIEAIMRNI